MVRDNRNCVFPSGPVGLDVFIAQWDDPRYRQMDESCGQVFCKIIEIPVKHGFHQIKFSKSFRKLCFFVAMELCHALCVAVCYGDVCVNFLSVFTWFAVAGYVTSHYFEKNHNLKKIAFSEFWRIFVFFFRKNIFFAEQITIATQKYTCWSNFEFFNDVFGGIDIKEP